MCFIVFAVITVILFGIVGRDEKKLMAKREAEHDAK